MNPELARLLEHPALWRGTSVARTEVFSTGFRALDERLPGGGWPRSGLIEILISRFGVGELTLLLPVLAALTHRPMARWCVWVAPPLEPFAPSLTAQGVALDRVLVVHGTRASPAESSQPRRTGPRLTGPRLTDPRRTGPDTTLWAFEQCLGSGACDIVMAWPQRPRAKEIRRLQLAAERGRTLGVLFRPRQAARESSHAVVRLAIEPINHPTKSSPPCPASFERSIGSISEGTPAIHGVRLTLLKSRGGMRGSLDLNLQADGPAADRPFRVKDTGS